MEYIKDAFETYKFMNDKNILLAFTGHFDHFVTTSLLKNVKRKFNLFEVNTRFAKNIYSLLVESIENVSKHSYHGEDKQNNSMLLLCKSDTSYTIITGNHILTSEIPALKEKLEKVSSHQADELKKLYRKQILSKSGGENNAGLGLIDIAIKSGNNIKFEFKPLSSSTSFYLLQIETNIY
jgi:hypothetical protein